jgi:hypothetical protein
MEQPNTPIEKIHRLIERCPSWPNMNMKDIERKSRILESLKAISRYPLDEIRFAEKQLVNNKLKMNYSAGEMGKLYMLNRMIFNVPSKMEVGSKQFASFEGIPHDKDSADGVWPLLFTDDGQIQLVGQFRGYCGPPYIAFREFDYFKGRYPRRKLR